MTKLQNNTQSRESNSMKVSSHQKVKQTSALLNTLRKDRGIDFLPPVENPKEGKPGFSAKQGGHDARTAARRRRNRFRLPLLLVTMPNWGTTYAITGRINYQNCSQLRCNSCPILRKKDFVGVNGWRCVKGASQCRMWRKGTLNLVKRDFEFY